MVSDDATGPANDDVAALRPLLSEQRIERIEHVLSQRLWGITVVLERLYDEGNIAAVLRTCEALGIQKVHLIDIEGTFKPAKRVGQGAHKWLTLQVHPDPERAVAHLRRAGYRVLAGDLSAQRSLSALSVDRPTAVVFGAESEGVTAEMRALCDETYAIPMRGFTQSLNISSAAAITLYELCGRYRRHIAKDSDLTAEQRRRLRREFYRAAIKRGELLLAQLRGPKSP
jgi:tRNA (guanosine-2'-O-)-methyltransferase